jgi:hypothetical protein
MYGETDIKLHAFLNSGFDGDEASFPAAIG